MGVQNLSVVSPPDGILIGSTNRLRPAFTAKWENNGGGGGPYTILHEWDTDIAFGTPIQDSNTGVTVFEDTGIPPSDMGPTGTLWYYRFTATDTADAGNQTLASAYTYTFSDPKLSKRHLFAPISVEPDFSARRISFPAGSTSRLDTPNVNELTANEAHIQQGIRNWQSNANVTVTATPQTRPQIAPSFGTKALEVSVSTASATPGTKSGSVASTDGFALVPSTLYSATVEIFTVAVAKEFRVLLLDYDSGDVLGTTNAGAWTAVSQNLETEIVVTGTTAADAANGILVVECRNTDLSNVPVTMVWYQSSHCVRKGAVTNFMPSYNIDGSLEILIGSAQFDWLAPTNVLVSTWDGSLSGFSIETGASGFFVRHGDGSVIRSGWLTPNPALNFNSARDLRITFDDSTGTWTLFVDGVSNDTLITTSGAAAPTSQLLTVGRYAHAASGYLVEGDIRYVEILDGIAGVSVSRLEGSAFPDGAIADLSTWTDGRYGRVWTVRGSDLTSKGGLDEAVLSKRHLYVPLNLGPAFGVGEPDDAVASERHLYVPINTTTDVPVPFIKRIEPTIVSQGDALIITGRGFDNAARDWLSVARLYDTPELDGTFVALSEIAYEDSTVNANSDDVLTVIVPNGASSGWVVVWNDSGA